LSESQLMPSQSTAYRSSSAGRSVVGSLTGRAIETQDTLDFSVLTDVRPMIETLPLAKAEEAYKRMMDGKARFRVVLTMT